MPTDAPRAAVGTEIQLALIDLPSDARPHSPEKLAALAEDMKRNGQLQEIIVRPTKDGRYEVVSGNGRFQSAQKLGWATIRSSVRDGLSEFDRLHIVFSENEEVEGVSPLYQAVVLHRMRKAGDLTQEDLADKLGKSRMNIQQYLSLVGLPAEIRENENRFSFLGLAHFIQILRIKDEKEQVKIAEKAVRRESSVRVLKAQIDRLLGVSASLEADIARILPTPDPSIDPLGEIWKKLAQNTELSDPAAWEVSYAAVETWVFKVKPNAGDYPGALADWFDAMGKAVRGMGDAYLAWRRAEWEKQQPRVEAALSGQFEGTQPFVEPRVPKTPAERAEFLALIKQGPQAAYGWMTRNDDPAVLALKQATWQDVLQISDPEKVLEWILKEAKKSS